MRAHRAAKRRGSYRLWRAAPKERAYAFAGRLTRSDARAYYDSVHSIIRPRGEFYYTDGEFAAMLEDIRLVRRLGFPGSLLAC